MNTTILNLYKQREDAEQKLMELNHELKSIEECLCDELFKETQALNKVLKNNLIEIVNMIHASGLKCSAVYNTEVIWHDTIYNVSDGDYSVDIQAQDETILKSKEGGITGKKFNMRVESLINNKLIPFCDREKFKYYDQ